MVAINTRDDLMRLLKEDAELRALLREMVSETVSEVQRDILRVQRETLAEIRTMRSDTNAMRSDTNAMRDDMNVMRGDIGHLVGDNLERKIGFRLPSLLAHRLELSDLEVLLYQERAMVVDPELQEVISQAYGRGSINQSQRRRLLETDMIVKARRPDDNLAFYPVEASAAIGVDDISRAEESAQILTAITGMAASPIVCGYRLTSDARDYNRTSEGRRATVIRIKG